MNEPGRDFLRQWQPGGMVLLDGNTGRPEAVTRLTNDYQHTITEAGGLPLFIAADQEPGIITALEDGFTQFPTPTLITATQNPELAARVGAAIASEMRAVGLNFNFAPVADLETNPNYSIVSRRSFGSEPTLVSPIIAGFIEGMQGAGVLATAKHFPGHGATSADSHTTLPVVDLPRERLETIELAPFNAAVSAGVEAVMVAHIVYPALEPETNLPASLSPRIITELLREEMGFDGLILTDALDMDAIDTLYSYPEAVVKAIQAGADMVLSAHVGPESHVQAIQAVVDAVKTGVIAEERINDAARRILDAKERYGILNWQSLDPETAAARVNMEGHAPLIDELFRTGVTVAFDRNSLIPLSDQRSLAVVYPATRVQIANECGTYRSDIRWVGVSDSPSAEEISWAAEAAAQVDTSVVFTQNAIENPQQQALVRALPPEKTVGVALFSPYDLTVFPGVSAYLVTYSPARPAVPAVCGILFGAFPARGKLAVNLEIASAPPG